MAAKKTAKKAAKKVTKSAKKPAAGKAAKVAKKPAEGEEGREAWCARRLPSALLEARRKKTRSAARRREAHGWPKSGTAKRRGRSGGGVAGPRPLRGRLPAAGDDESA